MARTIDIIKSHKNDSASVWKQEALEHRDSWCWMKYSMQIAIKVRSRMKELALTQTGLAAKVGCTQQYVSLLLKGKENLTLETIAKLESALDIQLFGGNTSALVSGYDISEPRSQYLSEPEPEPYGGNGCI